MIAIEPSDTPEEVRKKCDQAMIVLIQYWSAIVADFTRPEHEEIIDRLIRKIEAAIVSDVAQDPEHSSPGHAFIAVLLSMEMMTRRFREMADKQQAAQKAATATDIH